jgi:hypothetical protein
VVEPTYYMKRCFVSLGFDSDSGEDLDRGKCTVLMPNHVFRF